MTSSIVPRRDSVISDRRPSTPALVEVISRAFPHSRPDTQAALAAAGVRRFNPGATLLHQGDRSWIALVIEGLVALHRTTQDGRQLIVGVMTPGTLAGILPFSDRPVATDAVALTPSVVALWHAETVRRLAAADAGFAIDFVDHVLGRFEDVVARLDSMVHQKALRRVARVLSLYADLFFGDEAPLTRAHLPFLVGTSREMTGRVLRDLEARRIVARVGRDRVRLLDPAGLATAADLVGGTPVPRRAMG
jgi:CRP-like cAMP-binding protein